MCNRRTRTAGVYRTRAGSQAVLVLRLHIGLRQALSSAGPRDTAQRLRIISIPPCIYYQPRFYVTTQPSQKPESSRNPQRHKFIPTHRSGHNPQSSCNPFAIPESTCNQRTETAGEYRTRQGFRGRPRSSIAPGFRDRTASGVQGVPQPNT